jgi:hypothetical protein
MFYGLVTDFLNVLNCIPKNERIINECVIGKNLNRCRGGLLQGIVLALPYGAEICGFPVTIFGVSAKIRTRHLPETSQSAPVYSRENIF